MLAVYIQIVLLLCLLFLSGFFSGSETALFSLTRLQVEKMVETTDKSGNNIKKLLEQPRRLIITILLGNELVNVSISSISAALIVRFYGGQAAWVNLIIVIPVLLLLGEITPKTTAIRLNEKFAHFVSNPLALFSRVVTPLRWLVRTISDRVANLFVGEEARAGSILTEDVVKTLVEEGEREGIIDSLEREYIYRIFDFGDVKLDAVMTPRANLFYLPETMPIDEIIHKIKENHYSKVPIYRDSRDKIVGILFANDLIELYREDTTDTSRALQKIMRKPYFVPVTKRADELFQTFQRRKISVAIVLDEYGGVQGLVCMEDLLEVIFGNISDEFESVVEQHEILGEKLYRVNANMPLREFSELVDIDIVSDEVDTIGGFVFDLFGELPKVKSAIKYESLSFTVEKISGNRIASLLVRKI
jgi:putative hemolysin